MDNITREKLPLLYNEVFERNAAGVVILDHLWSLFADQQAKHPLDALQLAYQAGQRSVIHHIQVTRDRLGRQQQQEQQPGENE